jgi:stearoyl-CoA desaturase (delta-9 desaturase)
MRTLWVNPYYQTLYVVWGNQLLFFVALISFFDLSLVLISIVSMYIFGCMSEISVHRYFSHKSYETGNFREKLLLLFAFLTGQGATLSWVAVHRSHHAYEDTDKDPHSPQFIPIWKLYLGLFPKKNYKTSLIADLLRSKYGRYFQLENKYYWLIWTSLWIVTWFINFYLFFFIVSGCSLWYIMTETVNIFAHSIHGKKNDVNAVGVNSTFLNVLSGAGHHNNHHSNPKNYSYKVNNEIDVYAIVIEKFFKNERN